VIAALLLVAPGIAAADGKPLTAKQKRAGELFELADTHYAAGRYEQAAKYFEEGFELAPHPEFLYSLGNTYERMGQYEKAADFLRRYIESPNAEDVVSVKERIKRLEAAADARRLELERLKVKGQNPDPGDDDDIGNNNNNVIDQEVSTSNAHYYWFGGAAVGVAAGVTFGLLSRQAATAAAGSCSGGLCESRAESELDREKQFALVADVSLVLAAGAAAVGVYAFITRSSKRAPTKTASVSVQPMFTPSAAGVGLSGNF
jgi:tetratricopeptide (TPR) repeat protein